jgi:hypothetical protein
MKRIIFVGQLLMGCCIIHSNIAFATEGASSHYFPGSATTFATAVAPTPGFMFVNEMIFYSGNAQKAVLRGKVNLDLKAKVFYNYVGGFYTYDKPVLGGKLQIGGLVPMGHIDLNAKVGSVKASDSDANVGDSIVSAALYYGKGKVRYKLTESIFIPTGAYSSDTLANTGLNYWSFDTSLAITWLNLKKGTEITLTPGIMFNTKNTEMDYKSGSEFHVDLAMNKYFTKNFAAGIHSYYYRQVSDDGGSGAKLGGFRGESLGVGPAILWTPPAGKGKVSVIAKWLHDVHQSNRLHGDYAQLTLGYKF